MLPYFLGLQILKTLTNIPILAQVLYDFDAQSEIEISIRVGDVIDVTDQNVAVRRGSALAIGVLPYKLLVRRWKDVLTKLSSCCAIEVRQKFFLIINVFPFPRANG